MGYEASKIYNTQKCGTKNGAKTDLTQDVLHLIVFEILLFHFLMYLGVIYRRLPSVFLSTALDRVTATLKSYECRYYRHVVSSLIHY